MPLENQRRFSSSIVWLAFTVLVSSFASSAHAQEALNARQLVEASNAASDISRLGSFRLQALVVLQSGKGEATGTLTVDQDQDNTRQELEFTDYHEIALIRGNASSLLRKPTIPMYVAERIRDFERYWQVKISRDAEISSVSQTKIKGAQVLCFTVKDRDRRLRHCFDPTSHLLVSTESRFSGWTTETLFLDYQKIGDVQFPTTIRLIEPDRPAMEVRKIAVARQTFDADRFAPLPGVREIQSCRDVLPPKLLHALDPPYPQMARVARIKGEVQLLVLIGDDGKTHDMRAVSGHPILIQAAMDAVREWKYMPATCPSGPVNTETLITVGFHL